MVHYPPLDMDGHGEPRHLYLADAPFTSSHGLHVLSIYERLPNERPALASEQRMLYTSPLGIGDQKHCVSAWLDTPHSPAHGSPRKISYYGSYVRVRAHPA